jgi:hypothetical protein
MPLARLVQARRAVDHDDPLITLGEQVGDRELATGVVVDGDRADILRARRVVQQNDRDAATAQQAHRVALARDGRDEHAVDALFGEEVEMAALAF